MVDCALKSLQFVFNYFWFIKMTLKKAANVWGQKQKHILMIIRTKKDLVQSHAESWWGVWNYQNFTVIEYGTLTQVCCSALILQQGSAGRLREGMGRGEVVWVGRLTTGPSEGGRGGSQEGEAGGERRGNWKFRSTTRYCSTEFWVSFSSTLSVLFVLL